MSYDDCEFDVKLLLVLVVCDVFNGMVWVGWCVVVGVVVYIWLCGVGSMFV